MSRAVLTALTALTGLSLGGLGAGSCSRPEPIRRQDDFPPTAEEGSDPWADLRPGTSRSPARPVEPPVGVGSAETRSPASDAAGTAPAEVGAAAEGTRPEEPAPVAGDPVAGGTTPEENRLLDDLIRGVSDDRGPQTAEDVPPVPEPKPVPEEPPGEPPGEPPVEEPAGIAAVGETDLPEEEPEPTPEGPAPSGEDVAAVPGPESTEAASASPELEPPDDEEEIPPLTPEEIHERVSEILERLAGADVTDAAAAYRRLWEVRADLIPSLILETTGKRRTSLREIAVLVLDTKRFVRLDEKRQMLVYAIPGMGDYRYEELAAGRALSGRAAKVVLRDRDGFPVGVVIRAALVNRFRSLDYPSGGDQPDLVGWWRRYYERRKPKL